MVRLPLLRRGPREGELMFKVMAGVVTLAAAGSVAWGATQGVSVSEIIHGVEHLTVAKDEHGNWSISIDDRGDEAGFVKAMHDYTVFSQFNAAELLQMGHATCGWLRNGSGPNEIINWLNQAPGMASSGVSPVLLHKVELDLITNSQVYLCPDTLHNGTVSTPTPTPTAPPAPTRPPTMVAKTAILPPFNPPAGLGENCTYSATTDPAVKPVSPPFSGKVPTDPGTVSVTMVTNYGSMGIQLDNGKTPCTVNNFVSLAQKGFFDNTPCHRLTAASGLSVLQCGDPTGQGTGGPGYQFANEYPTNQYTANDPALQQPVLYPRGTVAMANAGPGTNGSQFFLVYRDSQLPPDYTVFGSTDNTGLATLDEIAAAGIADGSTDGRPATPVTIQSIWLD
jgi:peptidyl-prolyl cis-trans isomerase B (cyclophilin B)